jgi:galactokinase
MNEHQWEATVATFAQRFGGQPRFVARAPGRVNLIGEHTDYNEGFVLPVAIDREILIAARRRDDREVRLYAQAFDEEVTFALDAIAPPSEATWSAYIAGVALYLQREGYPVPGLEAVISGNVPIAAGLSSSAALEVAAATAFEAAGEFAMDPVAKALLCQRVENEFVGVRCGIMDQFIATLGRKGHALLIDCRSLEHCPVPIPSDATILIADSGVRRGLVESAYNERRAQCEEAARRLGVSALRDVTPEELRAHLDELPPLVARRARHVVEENRRVLDAVVALERGDLETFGQLMDASHASLRDLYEVSSPELDALVEIARAVPGCYGSRLTGAGFGGCTVSLVAQEAVGAVREAIEEEYPRRTGREPRVYVTQAAEGAEVMVVG